MTFDERFGSALRSVPEVLEPPESLSDDVLVAAGRAKRRRVIAGAAALVAGLLIAVPLAVKGVGSSGAPVPPTGPVGEEPSTAPSTSTEFPRPGGGSVAIHLYASGRETLLLDESTGEYRPFPYDDAALSPDRRSIAVIGEDGRLGVADRERLLREGGEAVDWTAVTGGGPQWSPDGRSVLVTDVGRDSGVVRLLARRLDLRTGAHTSTVIPMEVIGQVAWANDSERYVVLTLEGETPDGVEAGPSRYVEPDGSLGPPIDTGGGNLIAYAPSGDRALADGSRLMSEEATPSAVIDVDTGEVTASFQGQAIGWYDDEHYIRAVDESLEVVPVVGGEPVRTVPLGEIDTTVDGRIEVGPAPTAAPDLGF